MLEDFERFGAILRQVPRLQSECYNRFFISFLLPGLTQPNLRDLTSLRFLGSVALVVTMDLVEVATGFILGVFRNLSLYLSAHWIGALSPRQLEGLAGRIPGCGFTEEREV